MAPHGQLERNGQGLVRSMEVPQYVLSPHVYSRVIGGYLFLLDLKQDRYFALEANRAAALSSHVKDWSLELLGVGMHSRNMGNTGVTLTEKLARRGMLMRAPEIAVDIRPSLAQHPIPTMECIADEGLSFGLINAKNVVTFIASIAIALYGFRFWTFETRVDRVRRRRAKHITHGRPVNSTDAQHLVSAFKLLWPLFFASRGACLFEAFALLEFLSLYGAFPNWVFGVQAKPFLAHCWVQQDNVVFNDTIDHVNRFSPILIA